MIFFWAWTGTEFLVKRGKYRKYRLLNVSPVVKKLKKKKKNNMNGKCYNSCHKRRFDEN